MVNLRNKDRYDLSHESTIEILNPRTAVYWNVLEVSRHIGINKPNNYLAYWVARIRTKDQKYIQKRLGLAMSFRAKPIKYDKAVSLAKDWYASNKIRHLASDRVPVGSTRGLLACPIGTEFTIGHALREYIDWKRLSSSAQNVESVLSLINHHIVPKAFCIPVNDFKGSVFRKFCLTVLETSPKRGNAIFLEGKRIEDLSSDELRKRKGTLNKLIGILKTAVEMAWENGHIEDQRAWKRLHRVPNIERPRTIFLTRAECNLLLNECRPDLKDLVLGALYSGCRASELANLRVKDVAASVYGLFIGASKGSPSRYVFLPDEGMVFFLKLIKHKKPGERVFLDKYGNTWYRGYIGLFKKAVLASGLPKELVFHGLRHTYASDLIRSGASILSISQQLGHSTIDCVVKTYGHLSPEFRENEINRHFNNLEYENIKEAQSMAKELDKLKNDFTVLPRRDYGNLEQNNSWPKITFSKAEGALMERLKGR